jgi:AraC-like DNA-binding protein
MNGLRLGRTLIAYNRFTADTLVDVGEVADAVILAMGLGPPSTFSLDEEPFVANHRPVVISPGRQLRIHRTPGSGLLLIRASRETLEARFREVFGGPPSGPLVFERSVEPTHPAARFARQLYEMVADDARTGGAILGNPLLRASLDDALLGALLALPHSQAEPPLGTAAPAAVTGVVRRAEEFMAAHSDEPITISDVVAQCACSRRALFHAFKKSRGYTPMEFLKERRLQAAREALTHPGPIGSVTAIAYASGFPHLGRFAAMYRERFGERPSVTLRRSRGGPSNGQEH